MDKVNKTPPNVDAVYKFYEHEKAKPYNPAPKMKRFLEFLYKIHTNKTNKKNTKNTK